MTKKGNSPPPTPSNQGEDIALICGVAPDGDGVHLLRRRNNQLEAGVVRSLREGQPIHGEVLKLTPREGQPLLCDVEVQLPAPQASSTTGPAQRETSGPPQVSSDSYRRNWDAIWKRPAHNKRMVN